MKFILILALINIYCLTSTASEKTNKKEKEEIILYPEIQKNSPNNVP